MGWLKPTGFEDSDSKWSSEASSYDDSIATYASMDYWFKQSWCSFIVLTHESMSCSSVRFYTHAYTGYLIDIDAYYSGDWHNVYEGTYVSYEWTEKPLESTQTITAFRFRFYNPNAEYLPAFLLEVDFYEGVSVVTTEAATQIDYQCGMGNGTITSETNATERGFGIFLEYGWSPEHPNSGTLSGYIDHIIAGFVGDVTWDIVFKWHGTLYKIETETGDFEEGEFSLVLGYPSVLGNPSSVFDDKLFKCEDYLYSAYAIIDGETYTGDWVAFSTLCDSGGDQQPTNDISDGNPTVPIIPIDIPIDQPPGGYPPFEWELPPEIPYPPWDFDLPDLPPWVFPDLPDYEIPDYPPQSFVGDFYYHKPYTKKDLDELRAKCIIYNKNSVEFALVLRHNMNVLREFFNMMTDYMDKDEFNDFTDLISPQRLKELYLDDLEVNDFKDMINGFIRNTVDDNITVNRNFSLIQEGLSEYETESDDAYFTEISSAMKTVTEDNPDVDTLKIVIDNLNQETASNFSTIMHNLEIVRARLL